MTSCGVFPSGIFPIKLLSILFSPFLYTDGYLCTLYCISALHDKMIIRTRCAKSTVNVYRYVVSLIFFSARCYASAAYIVMRCLSVCLSVCSSVTFVCCVKTNKHIIRIFSPSDSHAILVFPCQTA